MQHTVVHGARATSVERIACEELKADLEEVTGARVETVSEDPGRNDSGVVYLVGTPETSGWVGALAAHGQVNLSQTQPGPQGGVMKRIDRPGMGPIILLGGSDAKGAQNVVHDFARDALGVDPFRYFTGYRPTVNRNFLPERLDRVIAPPAVPILCYFDNDNDELANLTQPYLEFDKQTWKGVIDTLVRARYNAIDLHDHLGRSEFYCWPDYQRLRPDYHTNLDLLDWVIDYAHARGMLVQIPMYLAWEFRHIAEEEANSWTRHKQRWIDTWRYYLKDSPLGKGDLFLNRPRSQLWDCQYMNASNEDTGAVMTEAFTAMRDVVLEHNPRARLICDLYAHGQSLWHSGTFKPPHDYTMLWPNNGYGLFDPFPEDTRGYRFGTYMHAGFWLNHVVHDPYPERIEKSMRELVVDHGANHYCLVNGQTFRHFILNLEAYSRAAYAPAQFDGAEFLQAWAGHYFGRRAAPHVVTAFVRLHEASGEGYVKLMHELVATEQACVMKDVAGDIRGMEEAVETTAHRLETLQDALKAAECANELAQDQADFCHDHLVLPIRVFTETMAVHLALQKAMLAWNRYRHIRDRSYLEQIKDQMERLIASSEKAEANRHLREAARLLRVHLKTREAGDKNPKWKGWYDPAKRRPNGGFPDIEALEKAEF